MNIVPSGRDTWKMQCGRCRKPILFTGLGVNPERFSTIDIEPIKNYIDKWISAKPTDEIQPIPALTRGKFNQDDMINNLVDGFVLTCVTEKDCRTCSVDAQRECSTLAKCVFKQRLGNGFLIMCIVDKGSPRGMGLNEGQRISIYDITLDWDNAKGERLWNSSPETPPSLQQ
jgi:hypothetical protein